MENLILIFSLITMLIIVLFAIIGYKASLFHNVGISGWLILTLAGIKGGLSIVMVSGLPTTFSFSVEFEAITVGIILMTIFIYGFSLLGYFLFKESSSKSTKGSM